ncbi:MAG: phosphate transport system substrate-binding protein [Chthoniobacter sp.]|nr:phosphate transport system substrate-binding protein [Chthoniobacter sp.]
MSRSLAYFLILAAALSADSARAEILRIVGSPTVGSAVAEAARILRAERGMEIEVSTAGGSVAGIAALGDGLAKIAMTSRPVTAGERAEHADVNFVEIQIGQQIVALGVSQDVWDGGVRSLSREQARGIYQEKVTNWQEVGGRDQKLAFYNADEARGILDVFLQWLYGAGKRPAPSKAVALTSDQEARDTLEFKPGAITLIPPLAVDGKRSFALAVRGEDGTVVEPTLENAAAGKYPMARPLLVVVDEKPTLDVKTMVDFLLSPRGAELLKRHGFHPVNPQPPVPQS